MLPAPRRPILSSTLRSGSNSNVATDPSKRASASALRSTSTTKSIKAPSSSVVDVKLVHPKQSSLPKPDTAPANVARASIASLRTKIPEVQKKNWHLPRDETDLSHKKGELAIFEERSCRPGEAEDTVERVLNEAPWPHVQPESLCSSRDFALDRPYSHALDDFDGKGILACLVCRAGLFDMSQKCRLRGGYAGFRKGNVGRLGAIIRCSNDATKILAECRKCGNVVGELVGDDQGFAVRCKLSSLNYVSWPQQLPQSFFASFDQLDTNSSSPKSPVGANRTDFSKGTASTNLRPGIRPKSRLLEYDCDGDTTDDDRIDDHPFQRKPRAYNVEFFSDSESDDSQ